MYYIKIMEYVDSILNNKHHLFGRIILEFNKYYVKEFQNKMENMNIEYQEK